MTGPKDVGGQNRSRPEQAEGTVRPALRLSMQPTRNDPRGATGIATVVVLALGCWSGMAGADEGPSSADGANSVTVFITGWSLGSLKPCGCSGGQLGGLERRAAILDGVPRAQRLVLDTGHWVASDREQDLIKTRFLIRAFQLLEYDVLYLAETDLQMALGLGLMGELVGAPSAICQVVLPDVNVPTSIERSFTVGHRTTSVRVLALDEASVRDRLEAAPGPGPSEAGGLDIYIVDTPASSFIGLSAGPRARPSCILCPAESDDPVRWSDPNADPLVVSLGRYGRHVVRLRIPVDPVQAPAGVRFEVQAVSEDLPGRDDLVALYQDYQQVVADSGLLGQHPRVPLPRDLAYTGSQACRQCHRYEYDQAVSQRHARAYATLENVRSHLDPECVVCHVVGLDHGGGFASAAETPQLKDVGCEACHGPGSEHVRTYGKAKTTIPRMACLDCHTPEQSGGYAGHEQEYLEKMRHWKELRKAELVQQQ